MKVAAIQMVSGIDRDRNLAAAERLIAEAAATGARLVLLPENFPLMGQREEDKLTIAEADGSGPIQTMLSRAARQHQIWLAAGTYPARGDSATRVRARLSIYSPQGMLTAHYDKLHLFDVQLPDGRESYLESRGIEPGLAVVTARADEAELGCSICYDLRFPELYRQLVTAGATVLLVPAAFTATTGAAHWHTLLRARAIENQCFVIAANQGGSHENGRATYGHSVIYDPWGECLAEAGTGEAVITAELDFASQRELRQRFPVLAHQRIAVQAAPSAVIPDASVSAKTASTKTAAASPNTGAMPASPTHSAPSGDRS
ncbi:carbon-nitrogen hydrolase family protein [Permianibacter sp. IMCC34836]|uniref:carbon-nitrogen hydrolase family protein n=1 Tax=Permianibacter fluminis TaxID=2738515 RepID=UPI0015568D20|nr:carbon-nitrogen hydrolase family protein [Permianibacter fluminis]NQD39012.1 carbon-nitrogen hydrolase family protein [Permianibacter fluminis]